MLTDEPSQELVPAWPPRTSADLERWLADDMPQLRDRLQNLRDRLETVENMQPHVTATWSQIGAVHTSDVSDPTYEYVRTWLDQLPRLRADIAEIEMQMGAYERAKATLPPRLKAIIEAFFETHLHIVEISAAMSMSDRTVYREKSKALQWMAARME